MDKQQYEEWSNLLTEMRSINDETKTATGETKSQFERMNTRLNELELAINRPGFASGAGISQDDEKKAEVKAAFLRACRKGYGEISKEDRQTLRSIEPSPEIKTYLLSDDTSGGFFAPADFIQVILKNVVLISPIRQLATVRPTSRESVDVGRRLSRPKAVWGNEQTNLQQTQSGYGKEALITHKLTAYAVINQQDLEDNIFPLETELESDLSEEFARAEGQAFVAGSGTNPYPEGLLTNSQVAADYSGSSTTIAGDNLIAMYHNLPSPYGPNAKWLLNRQTLGVVRTLKDSQGRYLLQPGIALGNPNTILDAPYVEVPDMPAVASGATPIMFGDIKKAYMIADRIGMSIQRLDQLFALQDAIGFKARLRVGGQVVLPEAVRKMLIHS